MVVAVCVSEGGVIEMPFSMTVQTHGLQETESKKPLSWSLLARHSSSHSRNLANYHRMLRCTEEVDGSCSFSEMLVFNITDSVTRVSRPPVERPSTRTTEAWTDLRLLTMSKISCKERKCGGTSASRDENGQVDVWR